MSLLAWIRRRFGALIGFVAALYIIHAADQASDFRLTTALGLIPRRLEGLDGVLAMPFLHGGWEHLAANTTPLLLLGGLILVLARDRFWSATLIVVLLGGALTWLVARTELHVGASGLIFGWFGFLVGLGVWERSGRALIGAGAALLLYGASILAGLVPSEGVSIEGHAAGLAAGLVAAWRLRRPLRGAARSMRIAARR